MSFQLHPSAHRVAFAWMHHVAKATYTDYVAQKKKDGEKPLSKDEWSAIVEGERGKELAKPLRAPTPDIMDLTKDDTGPVGDVVQAVKKNKTLTRTMVQQAIALVKDRIDSFGKDSDVSAKEQKTTKELQTWLKEFLGMGEEEEKLDVHAPALTDNRFKSREDDPILPESLANSLGEYAQSLSEEEDKANQKNKKIYERDRAAILERLKKHGLDEADLSAIQAHAAKLRRQYEAKKKKNSKTKEPDYQAEWEKENPTAKLPKKDYEAAIGLPEKKPRQQQQTPTEILRDFLKNVKDPDDRAVVEEMDEDEFMSTLNSLKERGKNGTLRRQVVRIAYIRPDLRDILLLTLERS